MGQEDPHLPVQLESLTIRRYRHLREPVQLDFGPGVVLLVGRNGTGKTNLLKLLDAVTRLDFRELERDPKGFDIEFVLRWGELRLQMALGCDPSRETGGVNWRYSGVLADSEHSISFRVGDGPTEPPRERVPSPGGRQFRMHLAFFLSPTPGEAGAWMFPMTGLLGHTPFTGTTGRYDEALGSFEAITTNGPDGYASFLAIDHQTIPHRGAGLPSFCPRQLAQLLAARPREARQLPVSSQELGFLASAARVCGFQELTCAAQIGREEPVEQQINTTYGPFVFRARLGDGTAIPHHDFSFGQKRIVAFFWYLECIREEHGAIVADELVNGMHHAAVRELVDAMAGLQAFLASQNPLLFDYMEYTSPREFQRRLILCETAPSGGWRWRSPALEESERFFQAHDVGYQHVHEILRDEGLW